MDTVELRPGLLHMFRFGVGQAYLWRDAGSLTLIDTGPAGHGVAVAAALGDLGLRLRDLDRIILTHFHEDHAGSAAAIAERSRATVLAHRWDAPVIRGDMPAPAPVFTSEERLVHERIVAAAGGLPPAPPCRVDQELTEGDLLDLGGGAAVIGVPGHTDGSIAIHCPAHRILFTGDSVARTPDGRVILGPFNVDRDEAIGSFRKLAGLDVDVACFGHGEPVLADGSAALRSAAERGSFRLSP
jgi:glyoxylase-like metal-dependent hydrolase (beta-lactamase superfamily II)